MKVVRGFGQAAVRPRARSHGATDTGVVAVVIWIFVALLVSVAVFVVASSNAGPDESLWAAWQRAWRARRNPVPEDEAAARAASVEPVDVSLAEFLRATASEGDGYLHTDELVHELRTARERAQSALRPRRTPHRGRARQDATR